MTSAVDLDIRYRMCVDKESGGALASRASTHAKIQNKAHFYFAESRQNKKNREKELRTHCALALRAISRAEREREMVGREKEVNMNTLGLSSFPFFFSRPLFSRIRPSIHFTPTFFWDSYCTRRPTLSNSLTHFS